MSSHESIDPENEVEFSEEAYLAQLRKSMAGFLAHKISFSLFEAGKNELLRHTLEHLVDERLREQKISLEPQLRDRLIHDIYEGLPVKKPSTPAKEEKTNPRIPTPRGGRVSGQTSQQ
ncbi:MAG: hypothetical protein HC904_01205 [Blastochloris sp.]|nr:hypothetical protein [Blastochloris sp.]